jgi:hypothetical protein
MTEPARADGGVNCREVTEMGWAWWLAVLLVPLALGVLGRNEAGGFTSVFLWGIVAFVAGSLAAFRIAAASGGREPVQRLASGRSPRGSDTPAGGTR